MYFLFAQLVHYTPTRTTPPTPCISKCQEDFGYPCVAERTELLAVELPPLTLHGPRQTHQVSKHRLTGGNDEKHQSGKQPHNKQYFKNKTV